MWNVPVNNFIRKLEFSKLKGTVLRRNSNMLRLLIVRKRGFFQSGFESPNRKCKKCGKSWSTRKTSGGKRKTNWPILRICTTITAERYELRTFTIITAERYGYVNNCMFSKGISFDEFVY